MYYVLLLMLNQSILVTSVLDKIMLKESQMEISKEQAEQLKRYLINADPFLFGVLEKKNKKDTLKELKELGFLRITPKAVMRHTVG